MLLIQDIADRWGVSLAQAKKIVRAERVPFVSLGGGDMRVNWRLVRFAPESVAAWEATRERVLPGAALPPAAPPATLRHLGRHAMPERRKEASR